ncbi:unnamed protein product [Sympodiomycopsis kandeliae]
MVTTRATEQSPEKETSPPIHLGDDGKTVVVDQSDADDSNDTSQSSPGAVEEGASSDEQSNDEEDQPVEANKSVRRKEEPSSTAPSTEASSKASSKAPKSKPSSQPSQSQGTPSGRLDPSLFQAYFNKQQEQQRTPSSSTSDIPPSSPPQKQSQKQKRNGIVTGRDGHPMKRLKDGRGTIVRSLSSNANQEDTVDDLDRLASKRSEAYKKRKLGLHPQSQPTQSLSSSTRTEDDPLGLGDPAFLPGGEFAHLAELQGKRKRNRNRNSSSNDNKVAGKAGQRSNSNAVVMPKRSVQSGMPAMRFRSS